jgi:hypothetical protein
MQYRRSQQIGLHQWTFVFVEALFDGDVGFLLKICDASAFPVAFDHKQQETTEVGTS